MKKARLLSILMAGALVAVGAIAQAQQPAKIPRIGIIAGSKNVDVGSLTSEFRRALRDLGYIRARVSFSSIVIERVGFKERVLTRTSPIPSGASSTISADRDSVNDRWRRRCASWSRQGFCGA